MFFSQSSSSSQRVFLIPLERLPLPKTQTKHIRYNIYGDFIPKNVNIKKQHTARWTPSFYDNRPTPVSTGLLTLAEDSFNPPTSGLGAQQAYTVSLL